MSLTLPTAAEWKAYRDMPVNEWLEHTTFKKHDTAPKRQQDEKILEAQQKGLVVLKMAANYLPAPQIAHDIATQFSGEILKIIQTKHTDVPLSFILAVPPSPIIQELLEGPIAVDDEGIWFATQIMPPTHHRQS